MFSGLLQDDPAGVVSGVKESGLQTFVWGFHCCNQEVCPADVSSISSYIIQLVFSVMYCMMFLSGYGFKF